MSEMMKREPILPDDYPMYAGYIYIVDGKPTECLLHGVNVGQFKRREGANEVRRCDLVKYLRAKAEGRQ